ncbi:MAG TPA: TatD family hydrolase [Lacipirellulaceae bacterium]|nr:TatD family hydrolase [Lacipirellulaceae bacterium]
MVELFDTHAHLDQPEFDDDRDEVIARARVAGVANIVTIGISADTSAICVELAAEHEDVFAAVGMQPNYLAESEPEDWDRIVALVGRPGVVAIGETGLDRYWDFTPFDQQQDYFDRHLRLSQERGLPFIVHIRDCDEDILVMLREAHARGPLAGVMHSFTGSRAMMEECVAMGLYISFAGMVTYKKSAELREIAAAVPDDRILIETDSPYLSPEPVRKIKRNEPAHVLHTAACLAEVRGVGLENFAAQTTANARRLFLSRSGFPA